MDDAHLVAAIRYVEVNPLRAGLVSQPEDWRWSSARAHVEGKADGFTDLQGTRNLHRNWRAMLRHGIEAGDLTPDQVKAIEAHERTGRPMGNDGFVAELEAATGRRLKRRKPGPKPREAMS